MDINTFSKYSRNLQTISPCELILNKEYTKFIELIDKIGISKNLKNIFDNWIFDGILEKQISFEKIELTYGILTFQDIKINKPVYEYKGNIYDLTPRIARENDYTYSGSIEITIVFTPTDINFNKEFKTLNIGNLPIMLGSKLCHLYNKTPEELIKMGECPNDPLGYFIIKGTEKIINIQEKKRTSQVFTFLDNKKILKTEITCILPSSSTTVLLCKNKFHIFEAFLPRSKDKNISIFILFDILLNDIVENNSIENVINYSMKMILKYVDEKYKSQIKYILNLSIIDAKEKFDTNYRYYEYLMNFRTMGKLTTSQVEINTKKNFKFNENVTTYDYAGLKFELDNIIIRKELFKHIYDVNKTFDEEKLDKANLLAYMVAHNCQCELGKEPDNKDNWMNKRLETAGRSIKDLFNCIWQNFINQGKKNNIDNNFSNTSCNFNNTFSKNVITSNFISAFAPNQWGCSNSINKSSAYNQNITDNMKRETSMSVISQIGRISVPINARSKDTILRSLQNTQLGYVCCSETPEGKSCGLAKNIAITTYISLERDVIDFENLINKLRIEGYVSKNTYDDKTINNDTLIIANGKIYGWCNKNYVLKYLKLKKRNGELPFDCCIYYNIYNQVLEYSCDSSRLLRPLLIIDNITNELVIDQKNLWDKTIDELYTLGAIELVDSREQDDITVAISIEFYRKLLKDKSVVYIEKEKIKKERSKIIDDIDYNIYKILFLQDNIINDIIEELKLQSKVKQSKIIKDIIQIFNYTNKILLNNFLNYEINELLVILKKYTDIKLLPKIFNTLRDEFKIDDLINEYLIEIYTHCELDPISIFGIASSLIPKSDSNQGPRTVYQASMCKQALGPYHYNKHLRFDTSYKCLDNPQRPIFETFLSESFGLNIMPTGQNPIIAYLALDANNEDAIVAKKEYFDANNCSYTKYLTKIYYSENTLNEFFKYPENIPENIKYKFHAIQENGLPRLGAEIKENDTILGKITIDKNNVVSNESLKAQKGEDGIVDRILITKNSEGTIIVRIKLRQKRKIISGDKLASRYSQKGTISKILPSFQLPRISSGINKGLIPDFFINPNSSISRMTQGKFKELLSSKAALYNNTRIDATSFHFTNFQDSIDMLELNGDKYGDEIMEHPNGMKLKCKVFIAPCNYQCLKHHVSDKIQIRGGGVKYGYEEINRQPVKGRNVVGGLRIGEMERDSFISHGSSAILLDRMMVCADRYLTSFCKTCGNIAISELETKTSICKTCGPEAEIGTVKLCYIFKLIINMLNAIAISVKLKLKNKYEKDDNYAERFLN